LKATILEEKDGGLESTNCHSSVYKDTHIYVVNNPNEKSKANAMVVEVTPRLREKMIDWTTKGLKSFVGKYVVIDGYLFCDSEHKQNSKADSPKGGNIWRSTCYEIHPVTGIKILALFSYIVFFLVQSTHGPAFPRWAFFRHQCP